MSEIKFASQELITGAKTAIEMEVEGHALYTEAAKKTKNPLAKSTLEAIAAKELLHKKAIEDFYVRLTNMSAESMPFVELKHWSDRLNKEIFNSIKNSLRQSSTPDKEILKAYETAMDMETKSNQFYNKLNEESDDQDAKKLFHFLAEEENMHYVILEDTLLYLSNPSEWFHKEERWLVEG